MPKLAILGGPPVRTKLFPKYNTIGKEEKEAVARVLDSGILSKFLGCWHEDFYGGPEVRALEEEWADYFGVKHAIAVNSCTSGLYCAVGATGIEPGEEVIVSPYTMSASATAPLIYNAIPIFADIEPDYYCLDPKSVQQRLTPRTRAIIVVDLFGQPYAADEINAIAKEHNLVVIEDCAQAPGAKYKGKFAGTLGDIGVFSLNYHKHIHCGEGGVVVTDNDEFAEKIRLIRNHAEAVVEAKGVTDITNMIGFNFRMTEIEAAIVRCQLKKLELLLAQRIENVLYLEARLEDVDCLTMPSIREGAQHVYYVHTITYDSGADGLLREIFVEAVKAELPPIELRETEGIKMGCGYCKPLYCQPLFKKKAAYGQEGYPFDRSQSYNQGLCPVAEDCYSRSLITHELMRPGMTTNDLDDVVAAIEKVWSYRDCLAKEIK